MSFSTLTSSSFGKIVASLFAAMALFAMATSSHAAGHSGKTHTIKIENFKFVPASVDVREGDMVIWVNNDSAPHSIVDRDTGKTISPTLATGEEFKFRATGAMDYKCGLHPSMLGSLDSSY